MSKFSTFLVRHELILKVVQVSVFIEHLPMNSCVIFLYSNFEQDKKFTRRHRISKLFWNIFCVFIYLIHAMSYSRFSIFIKKNSLKNFCNLFYKMPRITTTTTFHLSLRHSNNYFSFFDETSLNFFFIFSNKKCLNWKYPFRDDSFTSLEMACKSLLVWVSASWVHQKTRKNSRKNSSSCSYDEWNNVNICLLTHSLALLYLKRDLDLLCSKFFFFAIL